ncbi:MAG: peptidylprolyl isomerase [Phycisphaeraceae bacterium]|nr:peptidylprolyl isomerase [Phycisphaeraceae bacterium]
MIARTLGAPLILLVASCTQNSGAPDRQASSGTTKADVVIVVMSTTKGDITLELDPVHAPLSTASFLDHAKAGHYDNTAFQRVIPDFVIQGGGWTIDPSAPGGLRDNAKRDAEAGHPDVTIKNEWQNGLKNVKGTIALGREKDPDSASREFYINVVDNPKLDTPREIAGGAGYAVFGRVIDGWDVVEIIRSGKTQPRPDIPVEDGSMQNVPLELVVVKSVRVVDAR